MRTCLVEVDGVAFAIGFDWSAAGPALPSARVREEGAQLGADLVVEGRALDAARAGAVPDAADLPDMGPARAGAPRQYGYGACERGERALVAGTRAAAVWLAPDEPDLLACLHLRDHHDLDAWWVFARVRGAILAGYGDRVYATREEALASVAALRAFLPEGARFAEEAMAEGVDASLAWLAARLARPSVRERLLGLGQARGLSRYHGSTLLCLEAAVACLLLALGLWQAGGVAYDWLTEQGVTRAARELAQRREARARFVREHPEAVWTAGWVGALAPAEAGRLCLAMVRETPVAAAGWKWTGSACTFRGATASVRGTYASTPLAAYLDLPDNARVDARRPREMRLAGQREGTGVTGLVEDRFRFLSEERLSAWFLQYAQKVKAPTRLRFRPREKHVEKRVGTFECPWTRGEWSVRGVPTSALGAALQPLASLPGLRVTRVAFDRRTWDVRGEVYAAGPSLGGDADTESQDDAVEPAESAAPRAGGKAAGGAVRHRAGGARRDAAGEDRS